MTIDIREASTFKVSNPKSKIQNPKSSHQTVLILDFGSQFTQLIARRVRENRVYCEVHPFDLPLEEIRRRQPIGVILSGGPQSVYEEGAALGGPAALRARSCRRSASATACR